MFNSIIGFTLVSMSCVASVPISLKTNFSSREMRYFEQKQVNALKQGSSYENTVSGSVGLNIDNGGKNILHISNNTVFGHQIIGNHIRQIYEERNTVIDSYSTGHKVSGNVGIQITNKGSGTVNANGNEVHGHYVSGSIESVIKNGSKTSMYINEGAGHDVSGNSGINLTGPSEFNGVAVSNMATGHTVSGNSGIIMSNISTKEESLKIKNTSSGSTVEGNSGVIINSKLIFM